MKITVDEILKNTPKDQLDSLTQPKMLTVELEKYQKMIFNNQMMARALEKVLQEKTEIVFEIEGKTFGVCIVEPEENKKSIGFFQLLPNDAGTGLDKSDVGE